MTKQTATLSLSKPEITDKIVDTITQLASNFDILDSSLAERVKQVNGVLPDVNGNVTLPIPQVDTTNLATKTELNSVASGSPKGVYTTLSALQTAFPTGTTGIYLVTADGKWYYWSGSAWTAGGTYQGTVIPASSITPVETSFLNWNRINIYDNSKASTSYSLNTTTGALVADYSFKAVTNFIPVTNNNTYYFYEYGNTETFYGVKDICFYDANQVFISSASSAGYTVKNIAVNVANVAYMRVLYNVNQAGNFIITTQTTKPASYIPYSQVTINGMSTDLQNYIGTSLVQPNIASKVLSMVSGTDLNTKIEPRHTTIFSQSDVNLINSSNMIDGQEAIGATTQRAFTNNSCTVDLTPLENATYYFYNSSVSQGISSMILLDVNKNPVGGGTITSYYGIGKFTLTDTNITYYEPNSATAQVTTLTAPAKFCRVTYPTSLKNLVAMYKGTNYGAYYPFTTKNVDVLSAYKEFLTNNLVKDAKPLYSLKWYPLGDSITQYLKDGGYFDNIVTNEKIKYTSLAKAGATWEVVTAGTDTTHDTAIGQMKDIGTDADIITLAFGTNLGTLGTFSDTGTNTMCGAMHTVIKYILTNFPGKRIGGILPPQRETTYADQETRNVTIKQIYDYYSIPTLDMYHSSGGILPNSKVNTSTLGDGLHPSALGNGIYQRRLTWFLKSL